jgi:hypothetical protein
VASNAWERAQDAIAHASRRATERDEDVVTPDNAVSPYDASATTVLPHGLASRSAAQDPDLTQRIPQHQGGHQGGPRGNGHRRANGHHRASVDGDDADDARTVRFSTRSSTHPGTSPFPAGAMPSDTHDDGHRRAERDETPAQEPRRSWWRRLFGR